MGFVSYPVKQTFSHYHHQLDSLKEVLYKIYLEVYSIAGGIKLRRWLIDILFRKQLDQLSYAGKSYCPWENISCTSASVVFPHQQIVLGVFSYT